MGKLGLQELLIILLLVLVIFGGGKLAGVGKALGGSIRDFKNELGGNKKDDPKEETNEPKKAGINATAEELKVEELKAEELKK